MERRCGGSCGWTTPDPNRESAVDFGPHLGLYGGAYLHSQDSPIKDLSLKCRTTSYYLPFIYYY